MLKGNLWKAAAGLVAITLGVSTFLQPVASLPVFAQTEPAISESVESGHEEESAAQANARVITADDLSIQEGQDFDARTRFDAIAYDPALETVRLLESVPAFNVNQAGDYRLTYEVTPLHGGSPYSISRIVRVIPAPQATDSETQQPDVNETQQPDSTEDSSDHTSEEDSKEDDASSEDSDSDDSQTSSKDSSEKEEPKDKDESTDSSVKNEEEKADASQKDSDEPDFVEEEETNFSLQAKSTITVNRGTEYFYSSYGMGTNLTRVYHIAYNGHSYDAYCSQPSRNGPQGSAAGTVESMSADDLRAKILYYGAYVSNPALSPAGSKSFFAQSSYSSLKPGARYIVTHLALGIADGDPQWNKGANSYAQNLAKALYSYASAMTLPAPVSAPALSSTELTFSYDAKNKVQFSNDITFHANPEQSASFTVPTGCSVVNRGPAGLVSVSGNTVTVSGGGVFRLESTGAHAPDGKVSLTVQMSGTYKTYTFKRFKSSDTKLQNLVMLTGEANPKTFSASLSGRFLDHDSVTIAKVDENNDPLAGALMQITEKQSGKVIRTWTTETAPLTLDTTELQAGVTYEVRELRAPSGYVGSDQSYEFTLNSPHTGQVKNFSFTFVNEKTGIKIIKVREVNGEDVPVIGALLRVLDENKKPIEGYAFTTTENAKVFDRLPVGTYYLEEVEAPAGFVKADPVKFEITSSNYRDITVRMVDEIIRVEISKKDITTGEELPGATLAITDLDGNVIKDASGNDLTWVSSTTPHLIEMLPAGTYLLKETAAPDGYLIANDVKFTVKETGELQKVEMKDEYTTLRLSKISAKTGQPLSGAKLSVLSEDGGIVVLNGKELRFESQEEAVEITRLPFGTYVLHEDEAPAGYVRAEDVPFTISEDDADVRVEMVDDYTKVQISKTDITTGEELPGATLMITNLNGNVIQDANGKDLIWVSTDTPHQIDLLPVGEYLLKETAAPDGYLIANDVKFTVKETGELQKVEMKDEYTTLRLSKISAKTGQPLSGAKLSVLSEDGSIVTLNGKELRFESQEEAVEITRLPFGTYVLHEDEAPAGYIRAEDVTFTISEDDADVQVEMIDDYTKVQISKTDITTGEELPGATLTITDLNGNVMQDADGNDLVWVSEETPRQIDLLPAGEYLLKETAAPDGYLIANDVKFTVEETGEIQKVEMKDEYTTLRLSKISAKTGKPLSGAKLSVLSEDGSIVTLNGKELRFESQEEAVEITRLPFGTYVLHEDEAPAGYIRAEDVVFTISEDDADVQVEMIDDYTKVQISKTDITTGEELPGATLMITDLDGNVIQDVDGNDLVWVSEETPRQIDLLPYGEYLLKETAAPDGYLIANDVKFTVEETGEIQKVEMKDDYTKIRIEKTDERNLPLIGARLRLSDAQGNVIREFTSGMEPEQFDRLPIGKYVLEELEAPKGYALADPLEFEVAANGEVQTFVLVNYQIQIDIGSEESSESSEDKSSSESSSESSDSSASSSSSKTDSGSDSGSTTSKKHSGVSENATKSSGSVSTGVFSGTFLWISLSAGALILLVMLWAAERRMARK